MCSTEECPRRAAKGRNGRCSGCARWLERNPGKRRETKPREYGVPLREKLRKSALRLADADTNVEFDRAKALLAKYAQQQARVRVERVVEAVAASVYERLKGDILKFMREQRRLSESVARAADSRRHGSGASEPPTHERERNTDQSG